MLNIFFKCQPNIKYIKYLIKILVFLLIISFSTILEKTKDSVILKIINIIDTSSVQQLYKE